MKTIEVVDALGVKPVIKEAKVETHAVFDESSLVGQQAGLEREITRQILADAVAAMKDTTKAIYEHDMANIEKQTGRQMASRIFEAKVKSIAPQIVFESRAGHVFLADGIIKASTIKWMFFVFPDGHKTYLMSYEDRPMLPEYTVLLMKRTKIPSTIEHASARDFPDKPEHVQRPDGTWHWVYRDPTPLDDFNDECCGTIPGWRSALALLIGMGIANPDAIEREFGGADKATWAAKLGKKKITGLPV